MKTTTKTCLNQSDLFKSGALLVNITKSSSAPAFMRVSENRCSEEPQNKGFSKTKEVINPETGEIELLAYSYKAKKYLVKRTPAESRNERYILQSSAAKLLKSDAELNDEPLPRVCRCLRYRNDCTNDIPIKSTKNKAHYSNLQICGSVWSCPICASKVAEVRKGEVRQVVDTHLANGGGVLMLTLTFPHKRHDNLEMLLSQFSKALKLLFSGRKWVRFRKDWGWIGSVRALEVTYGSNGWHPHAHFVVLTTETLLSDEMVRMDADIYGLWQHSAVKAGFEKPSFEYGTHIQPAQSVADYIAKWGVEPSWETARELVNANTKKSKTGKGKTESGITPFDLLRIYSKGETVNGLLAPSVAGVFFVEYTKAFFGKRQLFWSKGLKELFGIIDISDEEAATEDKQEDNEITRLTVEEWHSILGTAFETRSLVLQIAETGGAKAVKEFVSSLPKCPPPKDKKHKKTRILPTSEAISNNWFVKFAKTGDLFKKH